MNKHVANFASFIYLFGSSALSVKMIKGLLKILKFMLILRQFRFIKVSLAP